MRRRRAAFGAAWAAVFWGRAVGLPVCSFFGLLAVSVACAAAGGVVCRVREELFRGEEWAGWVSGKLSVSVSAATLSWEGGGWMSEPRPRWLWPAWV